MRKVSRRLEPGISATDCLYAELSSDPGRFGCQHFEAPAAPLKLNLAMQEQLEALDNQERVITFI